MGTLSSKDPSLPPWYCPGNLLLTEQLVGSPGMPEAPLDLGRNPATSPQRRGNITVICHPGRGCHQIVSSQNLSLFPISGPEGGGKSIPKQYEEVKNSGYFDFKKKKKIIIRKLDNQ